jgi:hypothetical protein
VANGTGGFLGGQPGLYSESLLKQGKRKRKHSGRSNEKVSNCFPGPSTETPTPRGSMRKVRRSGL